MTLEYDILAPETTGGGSPIVVLVSYWSLCVATIVVPEYGLPIYGCDMTIVVTGGT